MSSNNSSAEICDILVPTDDYRNPWYNDENKTKALNESIQLKKSKDIKMKRENEINNKMVTDFIALFNDLNSRLPMDSEIVDNLKDKIELTTLQTIINEQRPNQV